MGNLRGRPASNVVTDRLKSRREGPCLGHSHLPSSIRASKALPGTNFQMKPRGGGRGKRADLQELLKKTALIYQTSRGNMWEKSSGPRSPRLAGSVPPPSSTVTALTQAFYCWVLQDGPPPAPPTAALNPRHLMVGAEMPRFPPPGGTTSEVHPMLSLGGHGGTEPQVPSAGTAHWHVLSGLLPHPPPSWRGASWDHCHIKCLHPIPCLCRNPTKVLALTSGNQR